MGLLSGLVEWWRWRMRRGRVHVHGIADYRNAGTIVTRDETHWRIEDDEGRAFYSPIADSSALSVRIGDRVEFEPIGQGSAMSSVTNRLWKINRKLDAHSS
jgi:hypothetical protein